MGIRTCKKCNGSTFLIIEEIIHEAELDKEDKDLTTYKVYSHRIKKIVCKKCNKVYKEKDFDLINF